MEYTLLFWIVIGHVHSCIISQSEAGKYTSPTGMHRKSCSSGRERMSMDEYGNGVMNDREQEYKLL